VSKDPEARVWNVCTDDWGLSLWETLMFRAKTASGSRYHPLLPAVLRLADLRAAARKRQAERAGLRPSAAGIASPGGVGAGGAAAPLTRGAVRDSVPEAGETVFLGVGEAVRSDAHRHAKSLLRGVGLHLYMGAAVNPDSTWPAERLAAGAPPRLAP
jgi:hypothetical protein